MQAGVTGRRENDRSTAERPSRSSCSSGAKSLRPTPSAQPADNSRRQAAKTARTDAGGGSPVVAIDVVRDGSERLRGDEHQRAASLLLLLLFCGRGQERGAGTEHGAARWGIAAMSSRRDSR